MLALGQGMFLNCVGLSDAPVKGILLDNVSIKTKSGVDKSPSCSDCTVKAINPPAGASADACARSPSPPSPPSPPGPQPHCNVTRVLGCFDDTQRGSILPLFQVSDNRRKRRMFDGMAEADVRVCRSWSFSLRRTTRPPLLCVHKRATTQRARPL